MDPALRCDKKAAAREKRERKETRERNRMIDDQVASEAMKNINALLKMPKDACAKVNPRHETPVAKREQATAEVDRRLRERKDKTEKRRSARCAQFGQRNASRLTKHAPPED
jgi:hypothetical protein